MSYIAALDGLRGAAILAVIYSHLSITHVLPAPLRASTLGPAAVLIFFVLSGFLITSRLLEDWNLTKKVNFREFYLRRFFRLCPALFVLLAAVWGMSLLGWVPVSGGDLLRGFTYTANYFHPDYWTLAHLWSLSVEEQFYLLWPAVLLLGPIRAKWVAVAAIAVCPLLRAWGWTAGLDEALVFRRFEMVADALALGCLGALKRDKITALLVRRNISPSALFGLGIALVLAESIAQRFWPSLDIVGISLVSAGGLCIIISVTTFPSGEPSKFFEWGPLVWLGKLSYSLYLWQQVFLMGTPHVSVPPVPFPLSILAILFAAQLSYYGVELPMRRFGRRLASKQKKAPALPPMIEARAGQS